MKFEPSPAQKLAIPWLRDRREAALFAGMGLGKTGSTLDAMDQLFVEGDITGVLIVAPLRVSTLTWTHEIQKWEKFRWMKTALLRTKDGMEAWRDGSADVYLVNYELLPKLCKEIAKTKHCPAQVVVWDEVSKAKSPTSVRINGRTKEVDHPKREKIDGEFFGQSFNIGGPHLPGIKKEVFNKGSRIDVWDKDGNKVQQVIDSTGCEVFPRDGKKKVRQEGFVDVREHFQRHWGLTGTPRPGGLIDLFAQARLLDGGKRLGKSFHAFRQTYFQPEDPFSQYPKWIPRAGVDDFITKKLSDLSLVLRTEDWLDIPQTSVEDLEVSLSIPARKAYKELEKEFLAELDDGGEIVAVNAAVKMGKLLQVTSGAVYDENKLARPVHDKKVKALQKFQKDHPGEPLLVATAFKHEQKRILEACPGAELFREDTLDRWSKGEIPMIVADPRSIGHGVDRLQDGGRIAIWFSMTWSRELYDQFNARLCRTGQEHETRIVRITCPGTVDDAVLEALRERGEGQNGFLAAVKNLQDLARV